MYFFIDFFIDFFFFFFFFIIQERQLATLDLAAFKEAKTLYGCVTRCRMYHEDRGQHVVVDLYTNVITSNMVLASLHRSLDRSFFFSFPFPPAIGG